MLLVSSLVELSEKEQKLHDAIAQMEMELVGDKHWSLMGEAKQRAPNSLLAVHLEFPQYHYQGSRNVEEFPDALAVSGLVCGQIGAKESLIIIARKTAE